jgi:hypothetical protein
MNHYFLQNNGIALRALELLEPVHAQVEGTSYCLSYSNFTNRFQVSFVTNFRCCTNTMQRRLILSRLSAQELCLVSFHLRRWLSILAESSADVT